MRTLLLPSLIAALALGTASARAQEAPAAPVAQPPTPATVTPVPPVTTTPSSKATLFMMGDFASAMGDAMPAALKAKIDLDARDMPVLDALKFVLDGAKMPYEVAPDATSDAKITMTLKGVPAYYALMMLTREAKLGWVYEKKDGKESVRLVKLIPAKGSRITLSGQNNFRVEMPDIPNTVRTYVNGARAASGSAYAPYIAYGSPLLPDTHVKLDVRSADIRDTLKKVLEQAKLDYVLEEDVPEDIKRSFTFENVPVATALDVVCKSAEIGWRAERREKKAFIRIGKKYARGTRYSVSPIGSNAGETEANTEYFSEGVAEARTTFPARMSPFIERRAVFTCPHCSATATIMVKTAEDKAAEERTARRGKTGKEADEKQPWKYCPVCGKPIDLRSQVRMEDNCDRVISAHMLTALAPLPSLEIGTFSSVEAFPAISTLITEPLPCDEDDDLFSYFFFSPDSDEEVPAEKPFSGGK